MFEVYFDDSGTHPGSQIAIAACYISTKRSWDQFVQEWNNIRWSEGFDVFHMVDFAASHDKTKKPFCDWDREKRDRVYRRLATVINDNKRVGIALAIPRDAFDRQTAKMPDWMRWRTGEYHYTYAVRCAMGAIRRWREMYGIKQPMQYVFDRMSDRKAKEEIEVMWNNIDDHERWAEWYGIEKQDGHSFQDKSVFQPLQAADILAWQMNSHMRNVVLAGKDELADTHRNFRILREDQHMELGFLTDEQLKSSFEKEMAFRIETGQTDCEF